MSILTAAWQALGEDPSALALVRDQSALVPLESTLAVGPLVHDAIAAASLSAGLLVARRAGSAAPLVELDPARITTAVTSEKHFRLAGEPADVWAELSGFWPTSDGWVRTHANYPHHRDRLLEALGLSSSTTADELLRHLHARTAQEIEDVVAERGGIAVAVRSKSEWREHPHAAIVAERPLISLTKMGEAPPAERGSTEMDAPARRVRVLDLSRVIAGPVATRTLALWGADVLRVDSPRHPEIPWQHLDSGTGKRSAIIDLDTDFKLFDRLLKTADVVVTGYRPGSLDRYGLSPDALAERRPGIVVARLSAWGSEGPFAERRGFDSIVQAATGISWAESPDSERPGALPAQALDHSAGYLLAAGITTALRHTIDEGGSWLVETSLARIAQELLGSVQPPHEPFDAWEPTVVTRGEVTTAASAPHYDGGPTEWMTPAVPWGSSEPQWLPLPPRK
ncbi:MAG: CoA transferase [Salinibacterium sp.]|nr:MAG: CoA transferase [Salinibacterium sp.]